MERIEEFSRRYGVLRVLVVTVVLVALGVTWTGLFQSPTYESSVLILVGEKTTGDTNAAPDVADLQELTLSVANAVPTTPVAEAVVERLEDPEVSAGEVLANTSAELDPGILSVNVSYKASEADKAQLIANTIGTVLSETIPEMRIGASAITATVWEPATLPETPASPNPLRNGLLTLVMGLALCVGLVVALPGVAASVAGKLGRPAVPQGVGQAGLPFAPSAVPSEDESLKEKELLLALFRRGKLTAVEAALESSLSVEEAERVLAALAAEGHLEVTVEHGRLVYALWEHDAPP